MTYRLSNKMWFGVNVSQALLPGVKLCAITEQEQEKLVIGRFIPVKMAPGSREALLQKRINF